MTKTKFLIPALILSVIGFALIARGDRIGFIIIGIDLLYLAIGFFIKIMEKRKKEHDTN